MDHSGKLTGFAWHGVDHFDHRDGELCCEEVPVRLVADEQRAHDSWRARDVDDADAVGQVVDDPGLVAAHGDRDDVALARHGGRFVHGRRYAAFFEIEAEKTSGRK